MNVGIHFSNRYDAPPAEEHFRRLARCKPDTIKTCLFPSRPWDQVAVHRRLRAEHPRALIVARLFGNGWPDFAAQFHDAIEATKGGVDYYEVHNEPNLPWEWSGSREAFVVWIEAQLNALKTAHPWARWCFPGMAVTDKYPYRDWWAACAWVIPQFDALGVHCYWQEGNWDHPDFGRAYEHAHAAFPNMPIIVTEFGDSTVRRSPAEKLPGILEWYRALPEYVLGSALFILGGTSDWTGGNPTVGTFDVTDAMADAIGALPRKAKTTMLTADGFDFPCGKPDGAGYYVAAGLATQEYYDKYKAWHPGEDWNGVGGGDTDEGHPVYAVANGRVEAVGTWPTWGNIVVLEHRLPEGRQVWSQYAHLHDVHVRLDDVVRRGQQIGTIGHMIDAQGNPTGPAHVHVELRCQYLPPNQWGLSREDVLRYYLPVSEWIRAHRPGTAHLPEGEPATDVAILGTKARWWAEELLRRCEAGDTERAMEIMRSLPRLLSRLEAAIKGR